MFQKFFTDTIMSQFIKGLLSTTNIPLFRFVHEGDLLHEGQIYIYDHWVIKCLSTGNLLVKDSGTLYPSAELYPRDGLYPGGGATSAAIRVLSHYSNEDDSCYNYKYKSPISYYDSETHKYLGEYLRFLRDKENLNLMPFYNCYNYFSIDNMHLATEASGNREDYNFKGSVAWEPETLPGYKLAAIPIKFNTSYTIAIDCPSPVLMRSIIYGPCGMISTGTLTTSSRYYSDFLDYSGRIFDRLNYNSPVLYSVTLDGSLVRNSESAVLNENDISSLNKQNLSLLQREKYLYLLIQLPSSNNSTITVIEGNYIDRGSSLKYKLEAYYNSVYNRAKESLIYQYNNDGSINNVIPGGYVNGPGHFPSTTLPIDTIGEYSLLSMNTHESYAFSDRLVEYLLDNVVASTERLSTNIKKLQALLYKTEDVYHNLLVNKDVSYGVWDDNIRTSILTILKYCTYKSFNNNTQIIYDKELKKYGYEKYCRKTITLTDSALLRLEHVPRIDTFTAFRVDSATSSDTIEELTGQAITITSDNTLEEYTCRYDSNNNTVRFNSNLANTTIHIMYNYFDSIGDSDSTSPLLNNLSMQNGVYLRDMDGNYNRDVEELLNQLGGYTIDV